MNPGAGPIGAARSLGRFVEALPCPQPWCRWGAWGQSPFLRAAGTGASTRKFCPTAATSPKPTLGVRVQVSLWVIAAVCFFPRADPDSQLYDMGYTPEEEAPACPDEFDDFVTFEASMSSVRSHKCWLHVEWDLGMEALPGERGVCCDRAQGCLTCRDKFSLWVMGPENLHQAFGAV